LSSGDRERRRLVAEVLDAEDRARERISQQLHDELLQSLLVIRQDLTGVVEGRAGPRQQARALAGVERAIASLRAIVFDLHPVVLHRAGLREAVGAVVAHHARIGGFDTDVEVSGEAPDELCRLALALVRELLSNVSRHAGARRAGVRLRCEGERLWLEVSDDGRGMDPEVVRRAVASGHIGLASVVHRVEALGGEVRFAGGPGQGTTVHVEIPAPGAG
jgi:two-component system, NarL family, sensor kinase